MNNLIEYIRITASKKNEIFLNETLIYIQDGLPFDIDLNSLVRTIKHFIPDYFLKNIDNIFIGDYKEFNEKDINAFYLDRAIYVTNKQSSVEDLLDDIVHEIAHSVEENYGLEIYGDGRLEREFLGKRKKLFFILQGENYKIKLDPFMNSEYDPNFDFWLNKKIGYSALSQITANLFLSPYAITSLSEYFADGFEDYFYFQNREYIKKISPVLFEKLDELYDITL